MMNKRAQDGGYVIVKYAAIILIVTTLIILLYLTFNNLNFEGIKELFQ